MPPIWYGSNNNKRFTLARGRFYYSGFVDSHGVLFEDFCSSRGRVYAVVVLLVCNVCVGLVVGGTIVTDLATVTNQVAALTLLFGLRLGWLVFAQPFLVPCANLLEALSTACQVACVLANLWILPAENCEEERARAMTPAQAQELIYWTMLSAVALMVLRVVAMSVPQLCSLPRKVGKAVVAGRELQQYHASRRLIRAFPPPAQDDDDEKEEVRDKDTEADEGPTPTRVVAEEPEGDGDTTKRRKRKISSFSSFSTDVTLENISERRRIRELESRRKKKKKKHKKKRGKDAVARANSKRKKQRRERGKSTTSGGGKLRRQKSKRPRARRGTVAVHGVAARNRRGSIARLTEMMNAHKLRAAAAIAEAAGAGADSPTRRAPSPAGPVNPVRGPVATLPRASVDSLRQREATSRMLYAMTRHGKAATKATKKAATSHAAAHWRRKAAQAHASGRFRGGGSRAAPIGRTPSALDGAGPDATAAGGGGPNAMFRAASTRSMASRWLLKTREHAAPPETRRMRNRTRVQRRRSSMGEVGARSRRSTAPKLRRSLSGSTPHTAREDWDGEPAQRRKRSQDLGQHQAALRMRVQADALEHIHHWGARHVEKIRL